MSMNDDTRLGDARAWLRQQADDKGAPCPCCQRFTKVYRRGINSGQALALITMWRAHGQEWQDKIATLRRAGVEHHADDAKLRYWGLLEEDSTRREDGGHAGWWHVTERGEQFVLGHLKVQKYALVYDSRCHGLDGPDVDIRDCLGDQFDLRELLDTPARIDREG